MRRWSHLEELLVSSSIWEHQGGRFLGCAWSRACPIMQTQQCQTGMCPSAGHRQKQERGLGRDAVQRRPFLLNVDSHSAKRWWEVQFPSPLPKASSRLSLFAAQAQKLWSYRGLFMRTYATCPAALPGLNAIPWQHRDYIPSNPGKSLRPARLQFWNGFHSCKLEDDPICLLHFCLLSYNYGNLHPRLSDGLHKICNRTQCSDLRAAKLKDSCSSHHGI